MTAIAGANASALVPQIWLPMVQDFLNNRLIAREIAETKYQADLVDGDTINFPSVGNLRIQNAPVDTDLTIDAITSSQSSLVVNQSRAVTFGMNKIQERQARADYGAKLAYQASFLLANDVDQQLLNTGVTGAGQSVSGFTTIDAGNIFKLVTSARSALSRANATDGDMFAVIDPEREAVLSQTYAATGFQQADYALLNQFIGKSNGFKFYVSNNLPSTQSLTVAVNPTAGDSFAVGGVTFNFVANGTATNPGDISIGANAAATQAIIVNAINGTGTPGASTYIDFTSPDDNRKFLLNQVFNCGSFSSNKATITAFGRIGNTATFTSGSNFFGTETTNLLFGRQGAIALGMQIEPNLTVVQEPKQFRRNYLTGTLYGTKVFSRNANRLCKVTINA